ncbi:MAG: hypothetical protein A3E87_07995 [Gammaproteobacteria bacterium RIFCSPHIGHO2_12_FULL_35_23]|nr:MAG: hypothetical protein A3E87_07995 [Gammaproteobacteria bacterium RIFCSPHIGHO2_12_FULL_35_23]
MSLKKFFLSWIVCTIIFILFDLGWHQVIFKSFYQVASASLLRPQLNYLVLTINDLYRGFLFTFAYRVFIRKHYLLPNGLWFGLWIGLLLASVSGMYFAELNLSAIRWLWLESANLLVQCLIAGILMSIICWRTKKTNSNMT